MSYFVNTARTVAAALLVGGFACLGPATATADPNSDAVAGMLSKGYSTSNCKPVQTAAALAGYQCGNNPDPSGPKSANYLLFADTAETAAAMTHSPSEALASLTPNAPSASGPPPPDAA